MTPDAAAMAHVSLVGSCNQPLASDGGLAFPDTQVGQTSNLYVQLVNDGTATIQQINEWYTSDFQGANAAELSTVFGGLGPDVFPDCTNNPFNGWDLGVGAKCLLRLAFSPTSTGDKSVAMHVRSPYDDSVDLAFPVHARAIAAAPLQASIASGIVWNNEAISFQVVNRGASAAIGQLSISPPFVISQSNCPSTMTTGAACTVDVQLDKGMIADACPTSHVTTSGGAFDVALFGPGTTPHLSVELQGMTASTVEIEPAGATCNGAPCDLVIPAGTHVVATAHPAGGDAFLHWSAPCGADPTCAFDAGFQDTHLIATFRPATDRAIALTISGTGHVAFSAADLSGCDASCTAYTNAGQSVQLTASGGDFRSWTGDCASTEPTCQLGDVISDRQVTATFAP